MTEQTSYKNLAEITLKAIVIALIITALLAASNVYLALKVGTTVAASIPAAVLAMGILRFFKHYNVLEINIIQTGASAGEGIAAAVSFVLPALIILHYWNHFQYWDTVALVSLGGLLGVLFSIPLRRVMLHYPGLTFPEGVAIGNVLKAGAEGGKKLKFLVQGGIVGGLMSLFQTGFQVLADRLPLWFTSGKALFGISFGFDPTMIGAGFIIGPVGCLTMLLGMVVVWFIGMPILTAHYGMPTVADDYSKAMAVWSAHIRFIGIGTMLLGGLWTLLTLLKPLAAGLKVSIQAMSGALEKQALPRTERDIPINYVLWSSLVLLALFFFILLHMIDEGNYLLSTHLILTISIFGALYIFIGGFFSAAVCGYFTGLVGSTNNPLSGILLCSILLIALAFLGIFSTQLATHPQAAKNFASALVIVMTTMIAAIASIANENLQDLKAGQMVGATPWKQQIMLLLGVVVSALIVGPILELLFTAYGIGGVFPRAGMDHARMLAAPQAGLMAAVAKGVLGHALPWPDLIMGMVLAVFCIILDKIAKRYGHAVPVLAMGLGIYLPAYVTFAIVLGGVLRYFANKRNANPHKAVLLACGIVAGSALMGVLLAVPFVLLGSANALSLVSANFTPIAQMLSVVVTISLCWWMFRIALNV